MEEAGLDVARIWLAGFLETFRTLGELPARRALAPEAMEIGAEVRVHLHGKKNHPYRVYFQNYPAAAGTGALSPIDSSNPHLSKSEANPLE
jgi:hypothetical protein